MDTKKLRQKILDLAIRGKLVPQDPNDEPASALLERIRAEKEQLIKEGKIKRSKKSAATDKSHYENVPFEIPESWVLSDFSELVTLLSGRDLESNDCNSNREGIPYLIGASNIVDGKINITRWTTKPLVISKRGDILISCKGTIGEVVTNVIGEIHIARQFMAIQTSPMVYADYIELYIKSIVNNIKRNARGVIPGISREDILHREIALPPLEEQKRIVIEVEKWLDFIADIEAEKDELESHIKKTKSKILDLAISGKLVPQDPNDEPAIELLKRINPGFEPCDNSHYENLPFEIPSTWVWVSHNDMLEISGGAQPPKNEFSEIMKPGYIRLYQIRDYGEKPIPIYIPLSTASKTTVKGDILLARYGGSLGKVFIAEDGAYNVAMAKVILCYPEVLNQKFVYYYYLSSIYQNKLRSISRTAQAGFNSGDFEDMYFPLPPLEEQGRIVDAISSIWEMIDMITAEL